jgi:FkbM family methyltransferase
MIKKKLLKIIPQKIIDFIRVKKIIYFDGYCTKSYAQEGEDIVLNRFFKGKRNGFYVEVGCHHPFRFSNTNLFYNLGWRGICIDPLPGTKSLFNKWRPKDIVLECGVSSVNGDLEYFMFNEPALNTFDCETAKLHDGLESYKIIQKRKIPVNTLTFLLDQYLPNDVINIDFFSIDVEGLDIEVLKSNNWIKYRPKLVIAESLYSELGMITSDPVSLYLKELNYTPYAKTGNSVIYVNE